MVIVWGCLEVLEGKFEEAMAISLEHVRRSRLEQGCIGHSAMKDAEDPNKILFYEEWQDMKTLQAHFAVPESKAFVAEVAALTAKPPTLRIFDANEIG